MFLILYIYMKNEKVEQIIEDLSGVENTILSLEKYYTDNKTIENLLADDLAMQNDLSIIKTDLLSISQSVLAENLNSQKKINDKNLFFEENKLKLDKKLEEYIINKDKKNSSTVFKLDIYDRNIEDNLFLIYYFLSYGILGLFIYKLLK
tara:strand:+ start:935 stop:1381 length:447 start_codon:yes stop_codon:yes gene_type:complete